jgi:hypothetical protein
MASPVVTTRIDWSNSGAFDTQPAIDTVRAPLSIKINRGRNADFSGEAIGAATLSFRNDDHFFTPDRNWADNPSFEIATTGWSTAAIASLTAAATSITQVTDDAGQGGTKAGEAVLTATLNSGVTYPLPYRFRAGVAYSWSIWIKSTAGTLNARCGLASSGTPADISTSSSNITTGWAAYTGTWTPSADRTDAVIWVRTNTASSATVRIDAIQLNPGAALNTYLEAPTKGQLVPGRPVHIGANYSSTDYAKFYGFIERIHPDYATKTVTITCYDVLRRLSETDIVVAASSFVSRSARDMRIEVLADYERGARNLVSNPSFETNTTGYTADFGGTLTRLTTDAAPGAGTACGQFAATGENEKVEQSVLGFVPRWKSGQTYQFSIYLRCTSGTQSWTIKAGPTAALASRTVTVTTAWQRFSLSVTLYTDYTDYTAAFVVQLFSTAADTVRLDGLMLTRGQGLHAYSDAGTGRWPNWCGNGSFDGASLSGWYDAWTNLVGSNPSFETNTAGWSVAADGFKGAATSIVRQTSGTQKYGVAHADVTVTGANQGAHFAITGTFVAGVTYSASLWVRCAVNGNAKVYLGSTGTPADSAITMSNVNTTYKEFTLTWIPSSNRTDVHFGIYYFTGMGATLNIDAAYVSWRDPNTVNDPAYSNTGPGGGGSFTTTSDISTAVVKYGSTSHSLVTPATSGAGQVYDFNHLGVVFRSGQAYTISVWIRATTAMPYRIGIGANIGDGTWDETSTTGTLTANTWTQVTVTWTPSGDRSSVTPYDVVLYVLQTDATGRTFYLDGVRVIPGSSADDFEMPQWTIAATAEDETYTTAASLSGSALSSLGTLNTQTLSRHWIKPSMTTPWYSYVIEGRDDFLAKTSAATLTGVDITNSPDLGLDRTSIVNVVSVTWGSSTEHYSDPDSVETYGTRPASGISGPYSSRTVPDEIGAALVTRYADPHPRPTVRRTNDFPNQLTLDLNDLVTITSTAGLVTDEYVILSESVTIEPAGSWVTEYVTEAYPY